MFALVVPASLGLICWVWFGRAFFGAGGWLVLVFAITVAPLLVTLLGVTTLLTFTQRRPASTGCLTAAQAWLHVVLWMCLFVMGLAWVDFGDAVDSTHSVLSLALGSDSATRGLSMTLALAATALAAVTWVGLLAALIKGNAESSSRREATASSPAPHPWSYGPPHR